MDRALRRTWALVAMVAAVGLLSVGCGDRGDGDLGRSDGGRLQISPASVAFSRVSAGNSAEKTVSLTNTGEGDLKVFEVNLTAKEGSTVDSLSVSGMPGDGGEFSIAAEESVELTVTYAPDEVGRSNAGTLEILSSDPTYNEGETASVDVTTLGNRPRIDVSPPSVRLPRLPPGESMKRTVTVQNVGSAPLTIYEEPTISGSKNFSASVLGGEDFPLVLDPVGGEGAGSESSSFEIEVEYKPQEAGSDDASLVIQSNEKTGSTAEEPTLTRVDVAADAESPCILVDGTTRNLGAVPLGGSTTDLIVVENCGTKPLEITGARLTQDSDEEFEVDLGDRDGNGDGDLDEAVVIEPDSGRTTFAIDYEPTEAGTNRATLVLASNDPVEPELEIDLVARGSEGACPETELTAKVKGVSAAPRAQITAAPLDYVILDGSDSMDPDGRIEEWNWKVLEKPEDVSVNLGPVDTDPNDENPKKREFRLLTAGTYKIGLSVKDNDGFTSCEQAVATISAIPNEKVHVELTWTNPEDPDEGDDTGSDVDVHMVKMGPGQWFEAPFDIYFRNPNNSNDQPGAGIWEPENPSLDIDDTDGAGPENIQMDDPQACQWYAVGVHYYKQLFGTAYATVRIYINSKLVYEKLNQPLRRGSQFWDVARIHWPTGQVYDVDNLMPAPPVEENPVVTESMASSGLCTAEKLY